MYLCSPTVVSQDASAPAARQLAEKVLAATGQLENVQLAFRNRSSLTALEAEDAFQAVEKALRGRGMRFATEPDATARISVTLSENPQSYLWIAEIQRGSASDLVIVTQAKSAYARAARPATQMTLRMKLLVEQGEPVLDAAYVHGDLLVLDTGQLSLFRRENDRWALQNAAALPPIMNLPRDPRGRLKLSGDSVQAYLPGMSCSASVNPALAVECARAETPWPLEQSPARLEPGKNSFVAGNLPAFYTEAAAKDDGGTLWIFAGADSRAVLYDDALKPAGTISGWGTDIAGLDSACGTGRQILVSLPGDSREPGSVQAFEVIRRQAIPVTSPVELPGPVTALWPLGSGSGVVAVSRDIKTGRYAAYELSIVCGPQPAGRTEGN